ncbi:MAG TPA: PIN domain-containing protein [Thermoleophilaceae bacterium]|nr:PIN domain-containing protein [Thermoleophilaceae bacterium]
MAGVYLDTSALGRLLLGEPDAPSIVRELGGFDQHLASRLLRVELRRLALREGLLDQADQLLSGVGLIPVEEGSLAAAETVPPASVATLDAIHLVTALRLADGGHIDAVMTYDTRLADGAREHGLSVIAPR